MNQSICSLVGGLTVVYQRVQYQRYKFAVSALESHALAISFEDNFLNHSPPNNMAKPDPPYVVGHEFSVVEHHPPEPLEIKSFFLTPDEAVKRQNRDPLALCLTRNPLAGRLGSQGLRLKIRDAIRVGDEKTSQVVLVDVISGQLANDRVVAKLYDPLYHDHSDGYTDPFLFVDVEYARQSAAYTYLHGREEEGIPEYYGSYSTEISHPGQGSRTVRLILVEYVDGSLMTTLPTDISQDFRKAVMEQIVDVETQLYKINLRHGDIHPRNIIIQGVNADRSRLRIKFIDFGHAAVGRSPDPTDYEFEDEFLPGIYISPLLRWFPGYKEPASQFEEWIDWDWNGWLLETYQSDIKNITPDMKNKWLLPSVREWFLPEI